MKKQYINVVNGMFKGFELWTNSVDLNCRYGCSYFYVGVKFLWQGFIEQKKCKKISYYCKKENLYFSFIL